MPGSCAVYAFGRALRAECVPQIVEHDRIVLLTQVAELGGSERFVELVADDVVVLVPANLVAEHEVGSRVHRGRRAPHRREGRRVHQRQQH
jgi:hypothetical protein